MLPMHDELGCITDAAAMYRAILAEADDRAAQRARAGTTAPGRVDPVDELRSVLPRLYASLSPAARALIHDHVAHCVDLVAFVYRAEAIVHAPTGSAANASA